MLTSTCGSCHETLSFENHLAGMTVRCKQCGQGWVRVPAVAGITASVPDFAEKRPATAPDAAVTDERLAARLGPLPYDPPTAAVCPRCGSTAFKRLKAKPGATLTIDRECKECGTPYMTIPAPMSGTVQTAMYLSGVVLIAGGVLALVVGVAATQEAAPTHFSTTPLYGVIFSALIGFAMLRTPQRAQVQREKRLRAYQETAPPGAPPPVEIPRPPNAVAIGIMYGAMALAAPLVSSLLTVAMFGPTAVVCGIVALAQGHLKGLIGLGLGAAGLIVWGSVFFFVFQG